MASQPPQDPNADDPIPEDDLAAGPHPEPDDDAPPVDPEAPAASDEPPSPDDTESEEWKSLEKKFENIEDEAERRRAIAAQYWEKTRYASKVRKENEDLKQQLDDGRTRRAEEARREPEPKTPAPPHPDLEKLDTRITALSDKDGRLFEQQQKVLLAVSEVDQDIAVVKDRLTEADENQRYALEQRLEGLEGRKGNLHDRFSDLKDKRDDLTYRLDELGQQREWTAGLLDEQGKEADRERKTREDFKSEFPQRVAETIDSLADAAGLDPEDETLRDDLRQNVKDRLTVKFWKLGQTQEVDDVDVDDLIAEEVDRYMKSRDLAGRKKFGKTSKDKLAVSRPPTTPRKPGAPPPKEPSGYDAPPKDISALGTVSRAPTMIRGRKALEKRGL